MIKVLICTNLPSEEDTYLQGDLYDIVVCTPQTFQAQYANYSPHVVVTLGGSPDSYREIWDTSIEVRKRWIHFESVPAIDLATRINAVYAVNTLHEDRFPRLPLVSVITPLYYTSAQIMDVYRTLRAQTYKNWEWILYDNTPDGPSEAYALLKESAKFDSRIRLFTGSANGVGDAKKSAFSLGNGKILVELDHDDYLTNSCLSYIVEAYNEYPEAGFYYTDCAEIDGKTGVNLTYGDTFAYGYGSYRDETYMGKHYRVTNYPSLNPRTIRHIVGVPNHVRAWRSDVYHRMGGHNIDLFIADDYELLVRTFLETRIVHIKRLGYIQVIHSDGSNTHAQHRANIQIFVAWIAGAYDSRLHDRLMELGYSDEEAWGGSEWYNVKANLEME